MIQFKVLFNIIGILLVFLGGLMFTALPFSIIYETGHHYAVIGTSIGIFLLGSLIWASTRQPKSTISKKDGYLIVTIGWLAISIFSALPYLFWSDAFSLTNAIFESVSGLTTTGATTLADIEIISKDVLYWRSLTQWIGGMGIIVLTVAVLPILGIGGIQLFMAESPGPSIDKMHPRIKVIAVRLWWLYIGLTFVLFVILNLLGMPFYDALNHSLTTMATGGFSTQNSSIVDFSSAIQYTLIVFMFIAGINYTIIYYGITAKFKQVWKNEEFKLYSSIVFSLILLLTLLVNQLKDIPLETSFREVSFQIISIITTTGFVSADYTSWTPFISFIFFLLLFSGACAGSTSGGIKLIRHLVFYKICQMEIKQLLHSKAVLKVKVDNKTTPSSELKHILVFFLFYIFIFAIGSFVMCIVFQDIEDPIITAVGSVATSLGNVGPAFGSLGPMDNFSEVPTLGKWILAVLMLIGRLEIFTVLIILTPFFWRDN